MTTFLKELRDKTYIGVVGGSDLSKIKEQLGEDGQLPAIAAACVDAGCSVSTLRLHVLREWAPRVQGHRHHGGAGAPSRTGASCGQTAETQACVELQRLLG